jgi:hypothetical protein
MFEMILGWGYTVPERLKGEGPHSTRKIVEGSVTPEKLRNTALVNFTLVVSMVKYSCVVNTL